MTAGTATHPGTREVAVELAACILATQRCVGRVLARQRPSIGLVDEQARAAFSTVDWDRLSRPVVERVIARRPAGSIPGGVELAPGYAAELGERLDTDAAAALAVAMDVQLSRGQHPDVAWQRAVAGYGLDIPAMRGYIAAAVAIGKDGGTMLLSTAKEVAAKALLTQADRIGIRETTAWSTLPATVLSKEYDPHQKRGGDGRWTAGVGGPSRVQAKEKAAPDALDEMLARVTPERYADVPDDADRYRYAGGDRYRYADVPFDKDRYREAGGERYAERYAGAQGDRYAEQDRYRQQPVAREVIRRVYLIGSTPPGETPPEPPVSSNSDGYGLYIPMDDMKDYFYDHASDQEGHAQGTVNFQHINDYLMDVRDIPNPVQLREFRSGWTAAVGVDVDDDVWADALDLAVPLWHEVRNAPEDIATQLDPADLSEIGQRAGYGLSSKQALLEQISSNVALRDNGVKYDSGLLEAVADYAVWNAPGYLGDKGDELATLLEDSGMEEHLETTPVPGVMTFAHGLDADENFAALHGNYRVQRTQYSSAIWAFDKDAPVGKIALRETFVKPERM